MKTSPRTATRHPGNRTQSAETSTTRSSATAIVRHPSPAKVANALKSAFTTDVTTADTDTSEATHAILFKSSPSKSTASGSTPPKSTVRGSTLPHSTMPGSTSSGASQSLLSIKEAAALSLSTKQRTALDKILTGCTLTDSARAAGVTRLTLYRWLNRDPNFRAAYNAWQQDALLNARTKLLTMADAAVNTVGHALNHDPRLAFSFLKTLGALDRPTPGPTDPREVEQRMEVDRQKSEAQLEDELLFSSIATALHAPPRDDQEINFLEDREAESE